MPKKMNSDGEANKQADQQNKDVLNYGLKRIDFLLGLLKDDLWELVEIEYSPTGIKPIARPIRIPSDQKTKMKASLEMQKKELLSQLGINLLP